MFREMRRFRQMLSTGDCIDVLNKCSAGTLAVSGDEGYPYAVPLSYVYEDNKIYFHCAKTGHKIDGIKQNPKVSFCVIDKDEIVPEEYTTYFRSVIVFGKARILEDEQEKREALEILTVKYSPEQGEGRIAEIEKEIKHVGVVEITIEHMSGKEAIELVRARG